MENDWELLHLYKSAFQISYELSKTEIPDSEKVKAICVVLESAQKEVESILFHNQSVIQKEGDGCLT